MKRAPVRPKKSQSSSRLKIWLISVLSFLILLSALVYFGWSRGAAFIAFKWFLKETGIPIEVHNVFWDAKYKEVLNGKIRSLHLTGTHTPTKIRFSFKTPVEFKKNGKRWRVKINPEIQAKPLPPLAGKVNLDFNLDGAFVKFNLHEKEPLIYKTEEIEASVEKWNVVGAVSWIPPQSSETRKPFSGGARVRLKELELLHGDTIIEEEEAVFRFSFAKDGEDFTDLELSSKTPFFIKTKGKIKDRILDANFHVESSLKTLIDDRIAEWFSDQVRELRNVKSKGKFKVTGKITQNIDKTDVIDNLKLKVEVDAKKIRIPSRDLTINGLKIIKPLSFPNDPKFGVFKVANFHYRFLKLFNLKVFTHANQKRLLVTTQNPKTEKDEPIVQNLWGGKMLIKGLQIDVGQEGRFKIKAGVTGGPFPLGEVQKDLCLMEKRPLDGELRFDYPTLEQTESSIKLLGKSHMKIFNGTAQTGNLSMDFSGRDPELEFSTEWQDLDMQAIGRWTGIGDMRGSIWGHLKDARYLITPLGPVPMDYDFSFEGRQRGGKPIRFYGRAIQNVTEMLGFSSSDLPWYAAAAFNISKWWRNLFPSKVAYMGIRAKTRGDWTEIRTFDPEDGCEYREGSKKRFLLCGDGFIIPLNSHGVYPAVLKTSAFQGWLYGFVEYVKRRIKDLTKDKDEKDEENECKPLW